MAEVEYELTVPWGQITCVIYGDTTKELVLLIHDFHDNSSSFTNLVPLLAENYCYASIDLPGHGKSSHVSQNAINHFLDYLLAIKYAIKGLLNRFTSNKSVILIGHVGGANLSIIFAQIYPKLVTKLILLESVYDYGVKSTDFIQNMRELNVKYFKIANENITKSPREFTFDEVVQIYSNKYKATKTTRNTCDNDNYKEFCHNLAMRSSRKIDNGNYVLRNDSLIDGMLMHTFGYDYSIDLLKKQPVQCPILILCNYQTKKNNRELLSVLKTKTKPFVKIVKIGKQKFHDENDKDLKPKEVAKYINVFLNNNLKEKKILTNKL